MNIAILGYGKTQKFIEEELYEYSNTRLWNRWLGSKGNY